MAGYYVLSLFYMLTWLSYNVITVFFAVIAVCGLLYLLFTNINFTKHIQKKYPDSLEARGFYECGFKARLQSNETISSTFLTYILCGTLLEIDLIIIICSLYANILLITSVLIFLQLLLLTFILFRDEYQTQQ